ncbi:MAG: alpha-amylase family glycosyl hydrolase [Phototrophicaceae bacterium]
MNSQEWITQQATLTIERLLPRCDDILREVEDADIFRARVHQEFPRLFGLLFQLYGNDYDFFYHLEQILRQAAQMFVQRPLELRELDQEREANPTWYQSEKILGAVCYVDLFAGELSKMHAKIPYFKELGITYLHLMPLFKVPETNNDGGYAISDYRTVRDDIGTMQQLAGLAAELRREGISLVLDFVFNHTSDEHEWAQKSRTGDTTYQNYYYMFPDRTMPDLYEKTVREIFPEQAPGNFTYQPDMQQWVWTSFYNFQWDLNYKNPEVFNAMAGEMLFLANQGVEVLRFDALAFIWKELGTSCESLPQAHMVIQAYNALVKIVAPAMTFKSEAIVHPDDVATYISWEECPLSYNPTLMALLWESLATRKVNLLQTSMAKRYAISEKCSWVNYVRVHDDIGWTFADEEAWELGINGYDHRRFLNKFYIGDFNGSFSVGEAFGYNEKTGDMRISGTAASLAGLEQAIEQNDALLIDMSIKRLLLIHSIILSAGGVPLIYMGDEIAQLNDYSWKNDPKKQDDSRWTHRQAHDWEATEKRKDINTIQGQMYQGLLEIIKMRQNTPALGDGISTFFPTQNNHVLGYIRSKSVLILANFSEHEQAVSKDVLLAYADIDKEAYDLRTKNKITIEKNIILAPYQFIWIQYN